MSGSIPSSRVGLTPDELLAFAGGWLYISRMARQSFPGPSPVELMATDAADVANLYGRCADYFLLQDGELPTLADAHALFTDVPSEKKPRDQTVLGWKGANGLAAVAAILRDYPGSGIWYLGFMIVDPPLRRQGFGRSIYGTIEDRAKAQGADEIRLAVLVANQAGERFWRSMGFGEIRRVGPDVFKSRSHHRTEFARLLGGAVADRAQ